MTHHGASPAVAHVDPRCASARSAVVVMALLLGGLSAGGAWWIAASDGLRVAGPAAATLPDRTTATGEPGEPGEPGAAPVPGTRRIDINTASAAELGLLPGIGPKLAERIIEDRARRGPFESVDALDRVKGIGPRTVERLRAMAEARP